MEHEPIPLKSGRLHYYGDTVRRLFIAGCVIMLVSLPVFNSLIRYPLPVSITAIFVIGLSAGIVAPAQKWGIIVNALIAGLALFFFEYQAVDAYLKSEFSFSATNQLLAVIFFSAFYYATKSVRGSFMKRRMEE